MSELPIDVEPNLKPKAECEGNQATCTQDRCPLFGLLGREGRDGNRRVKGCGDPAARGTRNRRKGDDKARQARKTLGLVGANTRHEELWGGALRVECKAGKQVAPAVTAFLRCETQSEQSRPFGDHRVFAAVWMPDGSSDGVVAVRLSKVYEFATALVEAMGEEP